MNYEQIKKVFLFLFFGRAFTREVLRFWQSKFLSNLGRSKEKERKQQKEKRAVRERERERERMGRLQEVVSRTVLGSLVIFGE